MIERKKYVCLDYEKRCQLEEMLKADIDKNAISNKLGVSVSTIYFELRKNKMTAATYDAAIAQKHKLLKEREDNV